MAASSSSRTTTSAFRRVAPRGPAVDLDRRWRHSAGVGRLRGAAYRVARRWRPAVQAGQLPVRSGESHLVVRRWILIGAGGIALALAGCAEQPIVWRADGGQQFKQDNYQCVQESRTSWSGGGS